MSVEEKATNTRVVHTDDDEEKMSSKSCVVNRTAGPFIDGGEMQCISRRTGEALGIGSNARVAYRAYTKEKEI